MCRRRHRDNLRRQAHLLRGGWGLLPRFCDPHHRHHPAVCRLIQLVLCGIAYMTCTEMMHHRRHTVCGLIQLLQCAIAELTHTEMMHHRRHAVCGLIQLVWLQLMCCHRFHHRCQRCRVHRRVHRRHGSHGRLLIMCRGMQAETANKQRLLALIAM